MATGTASARGAKVLVSATGLQAMVADIFEARGVREADADAVADALVWANLRGIDSHGVSRLPRYIPHPSSLPRDSRPQRRRRRHPPCWAPRFRRR